MYRKGERKKLGLFNNNTSGETSRRQNSAVGRSYLMAFADSKRVKASGLWVHSEEIHLVVTRVFHETQMRAMDGY